MNDEELDARLYENCRWSFAAAKRRAELAPEPIVPITITTYNRNNAPNGDKSEDDSEEN